MGLKFYLNSIIGSRLDVEPIYDNFSRTTVALLATGGTIYTPGDGYTYHVFTSPGSFIVSPQLPLVTVSYIAIGGGGGGGSGSDGGGGGSGGYTTGTTSLSGSIPITIGAGGAGDTIGGEPGSIGNNTTIGIVTTAGYGAFGGGEGFVKVPGNSAPLGSGGGVDRAPGGTGGPQGFPAGTDPFNAGGGGGAGGAGIDVDGGIGVQLDAPYRNIPGIGYPGPGGGTHWFAGGGGGGDGGDGGGVGGPYAGAKGDPDVDRNSSVNSGSGGGGDGGNGYSGSGGSGIVIIRYSSVV
jgi:hypothetical protein